jgi:hypothetical protein
MSAVSSRSLGRTMLFAAAIAVALLAFTATKSSAAFTITDFQLTPSPLPTPAGGHPNMHYHVDPDANKAGSDDLKKVVLDFPAGLLGNPEAATPKCVATGSGSTNKFQSDACPASSYIGSMLIKWKEPLGNQTSAPGSVYVLSPATAGSAATIGFIVRPQGWRKIFLKTEVNGIVTVRTDSDYGLTLTVDNIPRVLTSSLGFTYPITLSDISVNINARAGGTNINAPNGPYFTFNPTRCDAATTKATISSYSNVSVTKSSSYTPSNCSAVQFTPTASVTPTVTTPGAATGVNATFGVPTADAPVQQSHVRSIQTDLPNGTGLNFPAIGAVPATCTDAQLKADTCPSGAKIGTVSAVVPFLPPTMTGDVYLLTRNSSITFGYILRGANGIKAPLKGSAAAIDVDNDGSADRVRATASTMPQVPWTTATINFTSKLILNPANACGPNVVTSTLTGWSGASATLNGSWFGVPSCAPETNIVSGPSGTVSSSSATFGFSASIAGSTFACSLDNAAFTSCTTPKAYTGLTPGPHSFCVRATANGLTDQSPACRTWTVVSAPPTIGAIAITPLTPTTARITYTATDDSGVAPTCTPASGSTITILSSGVTTVQVTCADAEGNVSTVMATYYNPGGGPINLQLTGTPPSITTDTTPTFTWAVNQPTSGTYPCAPGVTCIQIIVPYISFACTMDGSTVPCNGLSYTSPTLPLGQHTFCVSAHGIYSGQNSNVACHTFTVVDQLPVPPVVTITSPATSGTSTSAAQTNVAYTVNGATTIPGGTTCTVNNTASSDPTTNSVPLTVGLNTITVVCTNSAGPGTATTTITRTGSGPFTPTFDQTFSSSMAGDNVSINWSISSPAGTEGIRRVRVNQDPALVPNYAAYGGYSDSCPAIPSSVTTFDVSSCPAQARIGSVSIEASGYASPIAGHIYQISSTPIPRFGIDVSGAIPGNPSGVAFQMFINTSIRQTDPLCDVFIESCPTYLSMLLQDIPNIGVTGISLTLGGIERVGSYGPLPEPFMIHPEFGVENCVDGSSLVTSAVFTGWNAGSATVADSDPYTCPDEGPNISITGGAAIRWTSATTDTLSYTVDPGDGDTPVCTIASGSIVSLNEGPNSFPITCTNSTGSDTVTARIGRDFRPPTITITSPVSGLHTNQPSPTLLYTVVDDWDASPDCTPAQGPIPGLVEGTNTISVTCIDHAGNTATVTRTITLDTVAPVVSANCSPQSGNSTTCTISVNEPATFTCKVNNGPTTPCTPPFTTNALIADFLNSITICATDQAGNVSCIIVTVGSPPPSHAVITQYAKPAAAPGAVTRVYFTPATAECRVNGGPFTTCTSPWIVPTAGLSSQTEHTYDVRAVGQLTTPARGHMWIDSRPYGATATVTPLANSLTTAATAANAGAHPDISASISVAGPDDAKDVSVQFPDGLMGSLRSVPVGSRCAVADATAGTCPASSEIGTISGTMSFSRGGATTATGTVYMVDAAGLPSQYAAGTAISMKNIPGGHGDLNVLGNLQLVDAGRALRLTANDLPRQTSNNDEFHLLSGTVTIKGDTGGAANPLITNPHFCGPFNPNRRSPGGVTANHFWGTATSWEGNITPEVSAPYSVVNCAAIPFNPTISSSFSTVAAGESTTMNTSVTLPNDNSPLRAVSMKLPSFIAPDFTAFGPASDQCSAGAYTGGATGSYSQTASAFGTSVIAYREFTPVNCPPQARIGTATITSPLVPGTLTADVYLSNSSPIPNIGIYVDPTKYGNPQGIKIGVFGTSSTPQVDPLCDPLFDACPTQISVIFTSLPDVPVSSLELTFGGVTGRTNGPNALLIATPEDPACENAGQNLITTFTPWNGSGAQTRTQLIQPTGCNQ